MAQNNRLNSNENEKTRIARIEIASRWCKTLKDVCTVTKLTYIQLYYVLDKHPRKKATILKNLKMDFNRKLRELQDAIEVCDTTEELQELTGLSSEMLANLKNLYLCNKEGTETTEDNSAQNTNDSTNAKEENIMVSNESNEESRYIIHPSIVTVENMKKLLRLRNVVFLVPTRVLKILELIAEREEESKKCVEKILSIISSNKEKFVLVYLKEENSETYLNMAINESATILTSNVSLAIQAKAKGVSFKLLSYKKNNEKLPNKKKLATLYRTRKIDESLYYIHNDKSTIIYVNQEEIKLGWKKLNIGDKVSILKLHDGYNSFVEFTITALEEKENCIIEYCAKVYDVDSQVFPEKYRKIIEEMMKVVVQRESI